MQAADGQVTEVRHHLGRRSPGRLVVLVENVARVADILEPALNTEAAAGVVRHLLQASSSRLPALPRGARSRGDLLSPPAWPQGSPAPTGGSGTRPRSHRQHTSMLRATSLVRNATRQRVHGRAGRQPRMSHGPRYCLNTKGLLASGLASGESWRLPSDHQGVSADVKSAAGPELPSLSSSPGLQS